MTIIVFCGVTPGGLVNGYQRIEGDYRFIDQDIRTEWDNLFIEKLRQSVSPRESAIYKNAWHHIPEDHNIDTCSHENVKI
jgi:hypothetical protein